MLFFFLYPDYYYKYLVLWHNTVSKTSSIWISLLDCCICSNPGSNALFFCWKCFPNFFDTRLATNSVRQASKKHMVQLSTIVYTSDVAMVCSKRGRFGEKRQVMRNRSLQNRFFTPVCRDTLLRSRDFSAGPLIPCTIGGYSITLKCATCASGVDSTSIGPWCSF